MQERFKGVVITWDCFKGVGQLAVHPKTSRIFFHRSELLNVAPDQLNPGDAVEFAFGEHRGKLCAVRIMRLSPATTEPPREEVTSQTGGA